MTHQGDVATLTGMSGSASCSSSGQCSGSTEADIRCGPCLSPLLAAAFDAKPQLASSSDTSVLTCDDARTLKFTLIVQGMPNSGCCLHAYSCIACHILSEPDGGDDCRIISLSGKPNTRASTGCLLGRMSRADYSLRHDPA